MLSRNERGYTKEINLVSWNGSDPKYDIRNWYPGRDKCGKGIALTKDEAIALMDVLRMCLEMTNRIEEKEMDLKRRSVKLSFFLKRNPWMNQNGSLKKC